MLGIMAAKNRDKGTGSVFQQKDGRWQYCLMHNGKRLTRSLGRDLTEKQLKAATEKARNYFSGQIALGMAEKSTPATATLDEIVADYLEFSKANHKPKSHTITRGVLLKVLKAPEFENRKVASLETTDAKLYRASMTGAGVSHTTVNRHLSLLRAALLYETKQTPSRVGKVPFFPMVKERNVRKGFLEYADHAVLLDCLPLSLRCLFAIAFHSGCRLGELLAMQWADVDWKNKIIRLPDTKNGHARNLPMWGSIEEHLKRQKRYRDEYHPETDRLFFWYECDSHLGHGGMRNVPGAPIKEFRTSWRTAVTAAHEKNSAVLPGLLIHDLRRSGVRVMVQDAGIPESQAMLISGHETRSTLERYNIVSLKNLQAAGAALHAWSVQQAAPVASDASQAV